MLSTKDIAWAAGLYEGEGNCHLQRSYVRLKSTGEKKTYFCEGARIYQKDTWILYRLKELFGGTVYIPKNPKVVAYWQSMGARGRGFLMTIYFLLSPRRQRQVQELGFLYGTTRRESRKNLQKGEI